MGAFAEHPVPQLPRNNPFDVLYLLIEDAIRASEVFSPCERTPETMSPEETPFSFVGVFLISLAILGARDLLRVGVRVFNRRESERLRRTLQPESPTWTSDGIRCGALTRRMKKVRRDYMAAGEALGKTAQPDATGHLIAKAREQLRQLGYFHNRRNGSS